MTTIRPASAKTTTLLPCCFAAAISPSSPTEATNRSCTSTSGIPGPSTGATGHSDGWVISHPNRAPGRGTRRCRSWTGRRVGVRHPGPPAHQEPDRPNDQAQGGTARPPIDERPEEQGALEPGVHLARGVEGARLLPDERLHQHQQPQIRDEPADEPADQGEGQGPPPPMPPWRLAGFHGPFSPAPHGRGRPPWPRPGGPIPESVGPGPRPQRVK